MARRRPRPSLPAAPLVGLLALTGFLALPLRAQVTPTLQPRRDLAIPRAPQGDLVITNVQVIQDGTGAIVALLDIKNVGQAPVEVPAGSVVARGEVAAGTIAFPAQKATAGYALHPGTSTQVTLPSSGWCPGGKPGAVTFRVNPAGTLAEGDRSNNTRTLSAGSLSGDLTGMVWLESQRFPPDGMTGFIPPALRNTLPRGAGADIIVSLNNAGPGYVVICTGTTLLRDVQSPLAATSALRTYNSPIGLIVRPGGGNTVKLKSAVAPIVLEPGSYSWQFLLNPAGTIAESNAANNAATATVKVTPPIP